MARFILLFALAVLLPAAARGADKPQAGAREPKTAPVEAPAPATAPAAAREQPAAAAAADSKKLEPDPPGMTRLAPDANAWVDIKHKRVVIDGTVALNRGQLEMFACLRNTKEHESIVSVPVKAYAVHAALLLVGAKSGSPVKFQPEYKPATGSLIEVTVIWTDKAGKVQRARAQEWIRGVRSRKEMKHDWVFAGSGFWVDDTTGQRHYIAEGGDFICVSNFPSAMLDLPIKSSQTNADLLFEAFTERIPPLGTKVRVVLSPKAQPAKPPAAAPPAKDATALQNRIKIRPSLKRFE